MFLTGSDKESTEYYNVNTQGVIFITERKIWVKFWVKCQMPSKCLRLIGSTTRRYQEDNINKLILKHVKIHLVIWKIIMGKGDKLPIVYIQKFI